MGTITTGKTGVGGGALSYTTFSAWESDLSNDLYYADGESATGTAGGDFDEAGILINGGTSFGTYNWNLSKITILGDDYEDNCPVGYPASIERSFSICPGVASINANTWVFSAHSTIPLDIINGKVIGSGSSASGVTQHLTYLADLHQQSGTLNVHHCEFCDYKGIGGSDSILLKVNSSVGATNIYDCAIYTITSNLELTRAIGLQLPAGTGGTLLMKNCTITDIGSGPGAWNTGMAIAVDMGMAQHNGKVLEGLLIGEVGGQNQDNSHIFFPPTGHPGIEGHVCVDVRVPCGGAPTGASGYAGYDPLHVAYWGIGLAASGWSAMDVVRGRNIFQPPPHKWNARPVETWHVKNVRGLPIRHGGGERDTDKDDMRAWSLNGSYSHGYKGALQSPSWHDEDPAALDADYGCHQVWHNYPIDDTPEMGLTGFAGNGQLLLSPETNYKSFAGAASFFYAKGGATTGGASFSTADISAAECEYSLGWEWEGGAFTGDSHNTISYLLGDGDISPLHLINCDFVGNGTGVTGESAGTRTLIEGGLSEEHASITLRDCVVTGVFSSIIDDDAIAIKSCKVSRSTIAGIGIVCGDGTATVNFLGDCINNEAITLIDSTGLSRTYTAKGTYATATVNFLGDCIADETITLINTTGLSRTYTAKGSTTAGSRQFINADSGNAASGLELCIENAAGHNGSITVSNNGSGLLTLTQAVLGTGGNITITENLTNVTASSAFAGGGGGNDDGSREFIVTDKNAAASGLEDAINHSAGHSGSITVVNNGAGLLTLTQVVCGSGGDTTITEDLTNVTVPAAFTGGVGAGTAIGMQNCISANNTVYAVTGNYKSIGISVVPSVIPSGWSEAGYSSVSGSLSQVCEYIDIPSACVSNIVLECDRCMVPAGSYGYNCATGADRDTHSTALMSWGPEEVFYNHPTFLQNVANSGKGLHLRYDSPCIRAGYDFPYNAYSGDWVYYPYIGEPESYRRSDGVMPVISDGNWHIGNYPPVGALGGTGDYPGDGTTPTGGGFFSKFLPFQID